MGEHLPCKQGVMGSNPIISTKFRSMMLRIIERNLLNMMVYEEHINSNLFELKVRILRNASVANRVLLTQNFAINYPIKVVE